MSDVHTIHENDDRGEQVTRRVVTITDAAGQEFEHEFVDTADGHEYQGDGEPPESATDALAGYLDE